MVGHNHDVSHTEGTVDASGGVGDYQCAHPQHLHDSYGHGDLYIEQTHAAVNTLSTI